MSRSVKTILSFAIVLVVGAALVAAVGYRGFSSREDPTFIEAFIARRIRQMGVPREARELQNPVQSSDEVIADARAHFADHCAFCHHRKS